MELERLVENGVLEQVDTDVEEIEWSTPMVLRRKKNGQIRIFGDFKVTLNKYLIRDSYQMPTIDKMVQTVAIGQKYSIIDLTDAYLQFQVNVESRKLFNLATPGRIFRYTRLPFGLATAPQVF